MITLKESILSDIEDTLAAGDDAAMKLQIISQLRNTNLYYTNPYIPDEKLFNVFKGRNGQWLVDVNGFITCYCTNNGELTDGTFAFNTIKENFIIIGDDTNTMVNVKCKCKSLKYGPKIVYGDLYISNCPNLKDLKDCPIHVFGEFTVNNSGITTLKYFPKHCEMIRIIGNKNLKTLKDVKKRCTVKKQINIWCNGITVNTNDIAKLPWEVEEDNGYQYQGDDSMLAKLHK